MDYDFRPDDVVCDPAPLRGTGRVFLTSDSYYPIGVKFDGGETVTYTRDGRSYISYNRRELYHGTLEQVFGNLPVIRPKRKVKKFINLFWDNCLGYHRVEYYPSEDRAVKDYKRMNEADYLTFKAVAVEIEVDE